MSKEQLHIENLYEAFDELVSVLRSTELDAEGELNSLDMRTYREKGKIDSGEYTED